ncbi:MAG: GNAT family N-acetyltransferase [Defluviitaleaceae bacterium]|nr:GNAT family N-acetyltransferase [Defluviitaleaceae bacterium]
MEIVDMNTLDAAQREQAARILTESLPLGWPSYNDAKEELIELLIPKNTMFAALENRETVGWGGIMPIYKRRVFELHPLVVREDKRGSGIGGALLKALEDKARERGGLTMRIDADDEIEGGETSFANVDLYSDFPGHLRRFKPGAHQTAFYLKQGYTIVGALPDANGYGKPDIFLAKRL